MTNYLQRLAAQRGVCAICYKQQQQQQQHLARLLLGLFALCVARLTVNR